MSIRKKQKTADDVAESDRDKALFDAARAGDEAKVMKLIAKGADVNAKNNDGSTPLHGASYDGHADVAKALIAKGADVNATDNHRGTPLHSASYNGHADVAKVLIAEGADINAKDNDGRTPLYMASHNGHADVAKELIAKGADANAKDNGGSTPLHMASCNDHVNVAKALIAEGADANAKDNNGTTPLQRSSFNGHVDVAKVLIAEGADANATNNDGSTPLHTAGYNDHVDVAKALIAKGADVNAKETTGSTPLHTAGFNGHVAVAKALIVKGADANSKTDDGRTALDVANSQGNDSVVELLKNAIFVCHSFISPWQYHMILHFNQEYHDISHVQNAIATNLRNLLDEVPSGHGNNYNTRNGFNDLGCYLNLCVQDGCARVELCAIDIHHSSMFCMGIRAIYRSIFSNGNTALSSAPAHVYCRGPYSDRGGNAEVSCLTLEQGEYLAEIRTRQGEITDQITLLTNRRTVSFGGTGGSGEDVSIPVDKTQKIIAFVGTSKGVLERLGAISVTVNWEVIGHIVLLRELIKKRRASLSQPVSLNKEEAVIQTLFSSVSDDVFKLTLSFLARGVNISD